MKKSLYYVMIVSMKYILLFLVLLLPAVTFAQSLQGLMTGILGFINLIVTPVILGIAFLIFLINAVRFFIIGSSSTEGQENARNLALYGIAAFVLILSLWGIVNLVIDGVFGSANDPCIPTSDYVTDPYGVRSGTSCPPPPAEVTIPPDQPLTPMLPDILPTLPSTSTPPVTPPLPTAPTTTLPGTPVADYRPVRDFANAARQDAIRFVLADLRDIIGRNNAIIAQQNLFGDLINESSAITERARMISMLRLENLGELPDGTAESYHRELLKYQRDARIPVEAQIQNFSQLTAESLRAVPLPTSALTRAASTNQSIANFISTNNQNITGQDILTPAEQQLILTRLYDTTATPSARLAYLDNLIANRVTDPNTFQAIVGGNLRTSFIEDINTELIYRGQSNFLN